jgi:transposase InsO family protein
LRPAQPADLDQARTLVARFVDHYNRVRLHSAIGYIAPNDFLNSRSESIWAARDRKLDQARQDRSLRRASLRAEAA